MFNRWRGVSLVFRIMHRRDDIISNKQRRRKFGAEFEKQEQKLLQVGNQFRICLNKKHWAKAQTCELATLVKEY